MEYLPLLVALLGGGLAGSILTQVIKYVTDRRQQKILSLTTAIIPYALPETQTRGGQQQQAFQVTYKGTSALSRRKCPV